MPTTRRRSPSLARHSASCASFGGEGCAARSPIAQTPIRLEVPRPETPPPSPQEKEKKTARLMHERLPRPVHGTDPAEASPEGLFVGAARAGAKRGVRIRP